MKKISALLASVFLFGQTAQAADSLLAVDFDGSQFTVSTMSDNGTKTALRSFTSPHGTCAGCSFVNQYDGKLYLGGATGFAVYDVVNDTVSFINNTGGTLLIRQNISRAGNTTISNDSGDSAAITVDTTNSTVLLSDGAIANSSGDNIISNQNGEIHIGENSLVTVENGGRQELFATDAAGNAINIDITRGTDLRVNGTSVMGSIRGLGEGVKATTALNAAFSAVPAFSGD